MSRQVARKFSDHVIGALEIEATRRVGRNLTMEAETTPPSAELKSLWNHQKEMSERLTDKAALISQTLKIERQASRLSLKPYPLHPRIAGAVVSGKIQDLNLSGGADIAVGGKGSSSTWNESLSIQ